MRVRRKKERRRKKKKTEAKADLKSRVSDAVRVRRKKKLRDSKTLRRELEVRP